MRRPYVGPPLTEESVAPDWFDQFEKWFTEAVGSGAIPEPNAMVLATATPDGRPSARTVLLKGYHEGGLEFFTNYGSRKGRELAANPVASCVLSWVPLARQIIVAGAVRRLPRAESAAYFASRPRGAQLGAWASQQSSVIASRVVLEVALAEAEDRFGDGPVPVPEGWGGFLLEPESVEFWQGRPDRLHDRLRFRHTGPGPWVVERLAP